MGVKVKLLASTSIRSAERDGIVVGIRNGLTWKTQGAGTDLGSIDHLHGDGNDDGGEKRDIERSDRRNGQSSDEDNDTEPGASASASSTDSAEDVKYKLSSVSRALPSETSSASISCIQDAQLSPDGSCFFTSDYNRAFTVYPIDHDILERQTTRQLQPYACAQSSDPIWACAPNPGFNLYEPTSTTVLLSRRDCYVTLHNALWDISQSHANAPATAQTHLHQPIDIHSKLASYKLIDPLTEAVIAPTSLAFGSSGLHFYAGHRNSISIFDMTYTDAPVMSISTIPSARSKAKGGGRGFKGQITALTLSTAISPTSPHGVLAAGSRTRYVGLYCLHSGAEITHFSLPGTLYGRKTFASLSSTSTAAPADLLGTGVTSMHFSPCGTYLYVAERRSNGILIYDVRNFSLALGYCAGRAAMTTQKMGFDVWASGAEGVGGSAGHEVWAGGTDGMVRVWRDPCLKEGAVQADEALDLDGQRPGDGRGGAVGATLVHGSGRLAVVARGQYVYGDEDGNTSGRMVGGESRPSFREWGRLDILRLNEDAEEMCKP